MRCILQSSYRGAWPPVQEDGKKILIDIPSGNSKSSQRKLLETPRKPLENVSKKLLELLGCGWGSKNYC